MNRCVHEKAGGQRCGGRAMRGSDYCYGHEPSKAIERREAAIRAGRAGGRGRPRAKSREVAEVKQGIREVIQGVHAGKIDKGSAAVMFQGFNTMLRAVELEHAAREHEERLRELEEMEERSRRLSERAREPSPTEVAAALSERVAAEAIANGESEEVANEKGLRAGMNYLDSLPDGTYQDAIP